jgi:ribosomal protein S18 acetylase RimI-like enzyme
MGEARVLIRRAEARDMAFIIELWQKLSQEIAACDDRCAVRPEGEIIWAKWAGQRLRDEHSCVLVAEKGDDLVGYLLGHIDEAQPIFKQRRHAIVTDLFVAPESRRRGVGTKLVEQALEFFRGRDIGHVRVNVLQRNSAARAFWEKRGFGDFLFRMWKSLSAEEKY